VKASLATFAHLGCLLDGQVQGTLTDAVTAAPLAGATIEAWQGSKLVRSAVTGSDGAYRLPLLSGSYTLKLSAAGYQSEEVSPLVIAAGQVTPVDHTLGICSTVEGLSLSINPLRANLGEMVTFTAQISGGSAPVNYNWTFGDGTTASGSMVSRTFTQPGLVTVSLTADNACSYPQTVTGNLIAATYVLHMPVINQ
jgi:PKD repeat protein